MSPKKQKDGSGAEGQYRTKRKAPERHKKPETGEGSVEAEEPLIDPALAMVIKYPVRVQIVAAAHQRAISPAEFARENNLSLRVVAPHFRALVAAGFLELVEEVGVRGANKHMYRAVKRAFVSDIDWSHMTPKVKDACSNALVQDLNGRLADAAEAGTINSRDDRCLFWLALTLDETSWPEFVGVLEWAIQEGQELGVDTVERRARGEGNGSIPVTFAVLGFESPKESQRKRKPKRRREPPPKGRRKS